MLRLWMKNQMTPWMVLSLLASMAVLSACKPGDDSGNGHCGDDKKSHQGSMMGSHHDEGDDRGQDHDKCDTDTNTSTNTNTDTATSTGTSTATQTDTGGIFPDHPGRVCTIDRFKQDNKDDEVVKKLDMLFVMDHSGSMADDWARVANNVQNLVKELPSNLDIHYAVLLANASSKKGVLYAPNKIPVVLDNQTMSVQQISNNLHKIFTEGMKVQDSVAEGEASFLSLYTAVTTNAVANQKKGFFRPDAALSILFMSDEQEIGFPFPNPQAPGLPPRCDAQVEDQIKREQYDRKGINLDVTFNAVKALKGDMPVVTHAFVNITKDDLFKRNSKNAKCLYDSLGYGYFEMVDKTKGLLFSLQADRAEGMAQCGRVTKERLQLMHDFPLSKPADKVDASTILAAVDGAIVDHEYHSATNVVHLENAGAAGSAIEIQHCEPEARQEWTIQGFTGQAGQYAASLTWKTPELATNGKIVWGLAANALVNQVAGQNGATNHVVTVSGLNPNTVYYFQAVNTDQYGVEKRSDVISLRTKPDWSLSGLSGQPSRNTVNISWKTAEYATTGKVRYGAAANALVNESAETAAANDHAVTVSGLSANTTYYFQAVSRDEFGLAKQSEVVAVTTLTDWGIVGFQGQASRNTASLEWQTPEYATDGVLLWGLSADALVNSAPAGSGNAHGAVVSGLSANTTYYFQAVSRDNLGVEKHSDVISLHTVNDWSITGFSGVAGQDNVAVSWQTLDYATGGKVLWGSSPDSLSHTVTIPGVANDHSANVAGLDPDTLYYFQAVSSDDLGVNRASEVVAIRTQAKPIDPPPAPVWNISDLNTVASTNGVNVTWSTSGYATSGKVLWGTSENALVNEAPEGAVVKDHSVTITGLSADTLYYVQAVSVDDFNQEQRSAVVAVRTLADEPTDPPPVSDWEVKGFDATTTATGADVIWQTPGAMTKATLMIGLSPDDLSYRSIVLDEFAESQLVGVTGLSASTNYYFKVVAVDANGRTVESTVLFKRTKN
jgi:hypothetical protein